MLQKIVARDFKLSPESILRERFGYMLDDNTIVDAIFVNTDYKSAIGVANLPFKVPAVLQILKDKEISEFILKECGNSYSILIFLEKDDVKIYKEGSKKEVSAPSQIKKGLKKLLENVDRWAGTLNDRGEHTIDLRTPSPGPHFYVNLLMGNRIGYDYALQTTPKSVVDRFGRGSFRSHADTQVLATRWDMRAEENGFPANRQFYIVEDFKKIFYSADVNDENIESAFCTHSQNHSIIEYRTKCGLEIKRTIFILPQYEGLPLATEVQRIEIKNTSGKKRNLKIVYTGMFGTGTPHAIFEDVVYTNVIMQASVLMQDGGGIAAISPDYYPEQCRENLRFSTLMIRNGNNVEFPKEFCSNYNEFVGNGTLENPENLTKLSNNLYRKGPGFFALAGDLTIEPGDVGVVDNFTGLVSSKANPDFDYDNTLIEEVSNLINKFMDKDEVLKALDKNIEFYDKYRNFVQLNSENQELNTYFNRNLPFQILYQTFVSRSFCQTQKGYREIGFREIQDVFATMYYFVSMGEADFVKQLLKEWCSKVFEFGFAYHNFYWEGKEPGKWSDDALWFIQAAYRYINLTGDIGFLDEEVIVAGNSPISTRPVYETIKAIIRYSAEISIGKHKMPLLDSADWNDCLKLDSDYIDGIEKEKRYKEQLKRTGGKMGDPFESNYTESVMNAFLLKVAIDEMIELSEEKGDLEYNKKLKELSKNLYDNIQEHAWKEVFFARALFNRYENGEFSYLGSKGDNLSADPNIDGSYFINSFSWSVLADCANEDQIRSMLDVIDSTLKTPYGIKLVTPTDLGKVADDTATGHYFPGDRENGAVFKHATMMATAAMFKAAKKVKDKELAARLANVGYWMVDLVLPFRTMKDPFVICGNPRICTQYNNSETGENIGPLLSGTATWLNLTMISAIGVEYNINGIIIDPILKEEQESLNYIVNTGRALYNVSISKPKGFYRLADCNATITVDGNKIEGNFIPLFTDGNEHTVEVVFE
ncbi:GH36-type glycosyl hydrolase domain-containing protein [Acetivibrio saccincola]|uniref:Glycosyl transferase n=1 Tax=Acetivibrio saccincola TaxID=1677857 RepID=A0A2S8RCU2_9FIRM|nr:glycosyl transferase [Acetivibrio saccincola]PQQ67605.1 glycosyl transferase [Acetivibrio saccincola]